MAQIVKLNVGGIHYSTTVATLMSDSESMLARMIDQPNEKNRITKGEELFIDRNGNAFAYVLDYLRCNDDMVALPEGKSELQVLLQEADFYQLHGLINLIKFTGLKVGDLVCINSSGGDFLTAVIGKTRRDLKASCYCWVCQNLIEFQFPQSLSSRRVECYRTIMGKILEVQGECAEIRVPYSCFKASLGDNGWLIDSFIKLHMPLKFMKKK